MIQKGQNVLSEHAKKRLDFKPELKQINFLDRRVYQRSEGVYYPSVTSILQYMPKNKFFESWLKDVGHNSDIIMRRAGDEGTQTHNAIEELLEGKELTWMDDYGNARYNELVWGMIMKFKEFWEVAKPELIFTEEYHTRRGYCCGSGCRHCPYEPKHNKSNIKLNKSYESRN